MASQDSNYSTHTSRWDAYQFSDPFAANSYVCCLKKTSVACRPSCDHYPKAVAKEDIVFLDSYAQAAASGFSPCKHCSPGSPHADTDIDLIKTTIDSINYTIGFSSDNTSDNKRRAFSTPNISSDGHLSDRQLTRNESEHIKLVELACRHIAAAAAENISKSDDQDGKKKRRGGVLGFKELASKSKLSPWHFHRVFKSVTGLTPKSYGDQCWKHMKSRERPQTLKNRSHFRSNSDITNNYHKPKRAKRDESVGPTAAEPYSTSSTSSISAHTGLDLTPIMPTNDSMTLNTNSLDINMAPMRHHSLDLGAVGLDSLDLNAVSVLNLSPQFVPVSNNMNTTPLDFQLHMQQSIPQLPELSQSDMMQSLSNDDHISDAASLGLYTEEPEWPSIETTTPPQDFMRLLTPPSSVAEPDSASVYNTFNNNSPLDNDLLFDINTVGGQNVGSYDLLGSGMPDSSLMFTEEDQHQESLFDGMVKSENTNPSAVNLMV